MNAQAKMTMVSLDHDPAERRRIADTFVRPILANWTGVEEKDMCVPQLVRNLALSVYLEYRVCVCVCLCIHVCVCVVSVFAAAV